MQRPACNKMPLEQHASTDPRFWKYEVIEKHKIISLPRLIASALVYIPNNVCSLFYIDSFVCNKIFTYNGYNKRVIPDDSKE